MENRYKNRLPVRRPLERQRTPLERDLVDRLLDGDTAAPEEFVGQFGRLIYSVLRQDGVCPDDLEDIYQSVFVHLWSDGFRRLRQWRGESRLSTFLAVVATRYSRDVRRARLSRQQGPLVQFVDPETEEMRREMVDPQPGPEAQTLLSAQWEAVHASLKDLSPRDAELIIRKHHAGQSYRTIAEATGMTINHVGVALSRAEQRLRSIVVKHYPGLLVDVDTDAVTCFSSSRRTRPGVRNAGACREADKCSI